MSNRYQQLFSTLKDNNEAAFVPFVCLGDPTPELSLQIVDQLVESGADALELGVPFSDPTADGPTIQQAAIRALEAGTTPTICFDLIAKIRAKHPGHAHRPAALRQSGGLQRYRRILSSRRRSRS